ncbi:MAG: TetR family transcriptional regulator [Jatrophihabitans sp.]|uniref:TetR/AcrR family transcriptional regulator n=1 Tax=Jatrophihabitans sp. TaxID=1932789 RepID=UPI003F7ED61B
MVIVTAGLPTAAGGRDSTGGEPGLRERIIAAALDLTTEAGWSGVTMGRLADRVGVSRQTVYNEVGAKPALAESMVLHELQRFLAVVDTSFDAHPGDLLTALRAAIREILEMAEDNPLLHAVASATHGTDTELLPLLTTHSETLLEMAQQAILGRLANYSLDLTEQERSVIVDVIVRTVLSHVMRPSGDPAATADGLAWVVAPFLR